MADTAFKDEVFSGSRSPSAPLQSERLDRAEHPLGGLWHGNTWHGALPRTAPGLRISLITYFAHFYLKKSFTRAAYSDRITQEMLDRNPERFATLTGLRPLSILAEFYCRNSQFA
jgi:hypothetical protein